MEEKSRRVCPVEIAGTLDGKFRKWIHNPKKILRNYLKEEMVALDVGCGPGFFSIGMAELVGESGKVIAADLQEGMLKKLKNKIQGTRIEKRIILHKCGTDKIGVLEKVDFVLAFWMVHEVPNQENFLEEIKSILKPDGILFIIEPRFHVSKKEFEKTIKKSAMIGFKLIEKPKVRLSQAAVFTI
jgi:ubiquinone/menaquinone biosynthesis C-methylase UbiE